MSNRAILPLLIGLGCNVDGTAQEHPFIAAFELTELEGNIRIDWTMQAGTTCNGTEVERSTDGASFAKVHRIDGICGSGTEPVPYTWLDEAPPEFTTLYYRVKLGINGYSSVKSVIFDQLTISDERFFPSPMADEATLILNVSSSATIDLLVYDATGRVVLQRTGVPGPSVPVSLVGHSSGVFAFRAESEGRVFTGSFVKQ